MKRRPADLRVVLPNPPLPYWEATICVILWVGFAAKCVFAVYETSRAYAQHSEVSYDLDAGWKILGRQTDVTDGEWVFWRDSLLGDFGKWLFGHVVVGQLLRWGPFAKRKYFFLVYSLLFYITVVGIRPMVLLAFEMSSVFLIAWFTASPLLVWAAGLLYLIFLNIEPMRKILGAFGLFERHSFEHFYLQEFTLAMSVLRMTSFGLCLCESKKKSRMSTSSDHDARPGEQRGENDTKPVKTGSKTENDTDRFGTNFVSGFVDFVLYIFYLPLLVAGPLMNFDVFRKQFHRPVERFTSEEWRRIVKGVCRFLFWGVVYDFLLHYLYSGALIFKPHLLSALPLWSVVGSGYVCGMLFVVKYTVIWALSSAMARLDQLNSPDVPSCGSHIYLYSQMWKNFDRGLYAFMKRHVYILIGGSQHGLLRQLAALSAGFGLICVWHGLHWHIEIWCLTNFSTVVLEMVGKYVVNLPAVKNFETRHLSPAATRRLHSVVIVPLLVTSTFTLVTFFAGEHSGSVFFYRLIIEGFPVSTFLVFLGVYCLIQTGKEVENYRARKAASETPHESID